MEIVIAILGAFEFLLTIIVVPMTVFIFKREVKRIDDVVTGQKEIKENYLDRFERVTNKLDDIHTTVTKLYTEHSIMTENGYCKFDKNRPEE